MLAGVAIDLHDGPPRRSATCLSSLHLIFGGLMVGGDHLHVSKPLILPGKVQGGHVLSHTRPTFSKGGALLRHKLTRRRIVRPRARARTGAGISELQPFAPLAEAYSAEDEARLREAISEEHAHEEHEAPKCAIHFVDRYDIPKTASHRHA